MIIYDKHAETRPTIRAVIYIRFSSKMQAESYSIEYQQEECLRYLESKGYKYVGEYIDKAKTAKETAGRDALEEMMYDAGRNKFDRIIVFSFSRSFRNTRDALNTNHELMGKHGIVIESVIEPIDFTSPHGKFSGTNLFAMHELQSDIIAAHARAGMYIAAKQGYYLGGPVPYGYDVYETGEFTRGKPRKKFCINEQEAEVVKLIFDMYLNGFSQNYIRDELLRRDVRTKNGNNISSSTINNMLKYDFYIGTRRFDVTGYELLKMENSVPAIIDAETFNAAQTRNGDTEPKPKPRQTKRFYPLTGKIVCAKCGKHYNGSFSKGPKKYRNPNGYTNYICSSKKRFGNCDGTNIRKDILEEYCIAQIKKNILTPEKIKEIAAFIVSQTDDTPDIVKEEFEAVEERKRFVMDTVVDLRKQQIEADEVTKEINAELIASYSKELAGLNAKLARLESIETSVISVEMVENYLNECALNIDSNDPHILKSVFDKLIEKIVIYDDKVELFLVVFPLTRITPNGSQGCPSWSLSVIYDRTQYNKHQWRKKR